MKVFQLPGLSPSRFPNLSFSIQKMGAVRPVECQGILGPQPHWGNGSKDLRTSPPSLGPLYHQHPLPQPPLASHSGARLSLQTVRTGPSPGPCLSVSTLRASFPTWSRLLQARRRWA